MLVITFADSEEEVADKVVSALMNKENFEYMEQTAEKILYFRDLAIYPGTREVYHRGKEAGLTFTQFEILYLLARSPGRIFTKEIIYDLLWDEPYSGDYNIVMSHISHIRKKIEDNPEKPIYIQTVWGVGYRFNANLGSDS
ncbi:MAG: winged helix-turn-helix domain-containing protein [Eubacteriales bacterium]|nr:winged helix-turn-helix domain-containing protein [Eubacteriales bacterium]